MSCILLGSKNLLIKSHLLRGVCVFAYFSALANPRRTGRYSQRICLSLEDRELVQPSLNVSLDLRLFCIQYAVYL